MGPFQTLKVSEKALDIYIHTMTGHIYGIYLNNSN